MCIRIFDKVDNLVFSTYIIGYKDKGESIIVVLSSPKTTKQIYYMGVIDSYIIQNRNETLNLVEKILKAHDCEKRKLDMLCWTHPHDDHTIGLKSIVEKYCDKKTLLLMPDIMQLEDTKISASCQDMRDFIKKLCFRRKPANRYQVEFATESRTLYQILFEKNKVEFKLKNHGPYGRIAGMQNSEDLNKRCISLLFEINGINIYLGADIDNMSIDCFSGFPDYLHVCKIPHHTSKTANKLVNKINPLIKSEVACTTTYKKFCTKSSCKRKCKLPSTYCEKSSLPNNDLLLEYNNKFNTVICTDRSMINSSKLKNKLTTVSSTGFTDFGYTKIDIDVIDKIYAVELFGEAIEIENS